MDYSLILLIHPSNSVSLPLSDLFASYEITEIGQITINIFVCVTEIAFSLYTYYTEKNQMFGKSVALGSFLFNVCPLPNDPVYVYATDGPALN